MPYNVLLCQTNSPKPKDTECTIYHTEKSTNPLTGDAGTRECWALLIKNKLMNKNVLLQK